MDSNHLTERPFCLTRIFVFVFDDDDDDDDNKNDDDDSDEMYELIDDESGDSDIIFVQSPFLDVPCLHWHGFC